MPVVFPMLIAASYAWTPALPISRPAYIATQPNIAKRTPLAPVASFTVATAAAVAFFSGMAVEDVKQHPRPILRAVDKKSRLQKIPVVWQVYKWWSFVTSRLLAFILSKLPIDVLIRRCVRWLAYGASKPKLQRVLWLCRETVVPIASGALALAEVREAIEEACESEQCNDELREQLEETVRVVEGTVGEALDKVLNELDSDGDGVVTFQEAADVLRGDPVAPGKETIGTVALVLEASSRASEAIKKTEQIRDGISSAVGEAVAVVDEAVAIIDEDGDGVISVQEALNSPTRIAQWWSEKFRFTE